MAENEAQLGQRYFPFGIPITRRTWEAYALDDIARRGDEVRDEKDILTARRLTARVNARLPKGAEPFRAGQFLSFALLKDVFRYLADSYVMEENPGAMARALNWVRDQYGPEMAAQPIEAFVSAFPPEEVLLEGESVTGYLDGRDDKDPERQRAAREVLLLALAMRNPALESFVSFFDDAELQDRNDYRVFVDALDAFFRTQPAVTDLDGYLLDVLRAPVKASPTSLDGQLDYIREHWAHKLPPHLLKRLLIVQGILLEENLMRGHGPGQAEVLDFDAELSRRLGLGYDEPERFSPDADWMSNVVLIAKQAYVWLDQLSRQHARTIERLDQIPDVELDRLAGWGFTSLWLIGVWERSPASRKIKQWRGNTEAAASAYSLFDYQVAQDLGGEPALNDLRDRANARGLRLASDMVPNHMGIDSQWTREHPDWFLQLDYPPYPNYSYGCENLSEDPGVVVQIEDGYWDSRDAAVTYKRIDERDGRTRYVYHGNDGTHMPWNDTAQLNYLMPEVREAVIQTILHVARLFPIIRFDAAMTLSKRHYQRLWFPQPGDGGAIPTRAQFGMTREEFDQHMPEEFWREVVDRVAKEAPDTLLLAEAFWLMEGYFVRTLGMHRVYNSAFMNMLKMEDNASYRTTVRNVLEFSPEVLKRFVNFMNNPDEDTAIAQFGRDDKYFGVAALMMTMPGLPMFGHGQVEGFTEKYGMEFRRAYWDESPDAGLIERHEREIFPLMRKRYLWSGVANFAFYDFLNPEGHVDEDVFAYSNRAGGERGLFVYNNAYKTTSGRVMRSVAINKGASESPHLVRMDLGEALGLRGDPGVFYIFRDARGGLEYLREGRELTTLGLSAQLGGYQYHAFVDWREVLDDDGSWAELCAQLNGRGAESMDRAYREARLEVILEPFSRVLAPSLVADLVSPDVTAEDAALHGIEVELSRFLTALEPFAGEALGEREAVCEAVLEDLETLRSWERGEFREKEPEADIPPASRPQQTGDLSRYALTAWAVLRNLVDPPASAAGVEPDKLQEWSLLPQLSENLRTAGYDDQIALNQALAVHALLRITPEPEDLPSLTARDFARLLVETRESAAFLDVNEYQGTLWVRKERLELLLELVEKSAGIAAVRASEAAAKARAARLASRVSELAGEIRTAAEASQYQVAGLIKELAKSSK